MLNIVRKFESDVLEDIQQMIDFDLESVVSSRTNWIKSLLDVTKNYLGVSDEDRVVPWEGASDVFIPMTMIALETAHPRILGGLVGLDQTITAVPTSGGSAESAENVSNFLNWALHSHSQIGAFTKYDRILHSSELCGRSYSSMDWKKKSHPITRKYTMPRYQQGAGVLMDILKKINSNVSMKMAEVPYSKHLQSLLGRRLVEVKAQYNDNEGTHLPFDYFVDGKIRQGKLFVPTPVPQQTTLDMYLDVEEVVKDAAELSVIYPVNIYHPVDETELRDATFVAERFWMNVEDLYQLRQDGIMHFEDAEWLQVVGNNANDTMDLNLSVARRDSRPKSEPTAREDELRDIYARAFGDADTNDQYMGVEVIKYYRTMRLDGVARDYIIYYMPDFKLIPRIVELGVEHPTGRHPYDAWEFMPATDGSTRSMGIGHIIMDLQAIINDVFNKQMDRDDLLTMPFGFYRPSQFNKGNLTRIYPGKLIPTNDPSAVFFPNFGRPTGADMPYIQQLLGFAERLTSATNYFQGSSPSQPNAPRTFGATAAIIQEGNVNFDLHIKRYQVPMYTQVLDIQGLYRHFMPKDMEFMAPGADTIMKISRADLDQEYGFVFKSDSTNTNPAMRRELSAVVYQSLLMNPLVQTSVTALHNITRRFALRHGYIEFDQDVPKPAPEMSHAPMSQLEEIQQMRMGKNVSVLPIDNHEEHIQVIEQFFTGELGMQLDESTAAMLTTHLMTHQQMAAMLQRAQMLTDKSGGVQPGMGKNPAMIANMAPENAGGE